MEIMDGKPYINQVRNLIMEYMQQLGRDLSFQNINEELKNPAKKYTAPNGELLVAAEKSDGHGCLSSSYKFTL